MTPRRLLLTIAAFLLLAVVTFSVVFIVTFDINRYRNRIEEKLSSQLARPVTLGAVHMIPGLGLYLAFDDVIVGGADPEPLLTADRLEVRISLLSLLTTETVFSDITLLRPTLRLEAGDSKTDQKRRFDRSVAYSTSIRALSISDGTLIWTDQGTQERTLTFDRLDAAIENLRIDRPIGIELQGRLNAGPAPVEFSLDGTVELPTHPDWMSIEGELNAKVTAPDAGTLNAWLPEGVKLAAESQLTTGLRIKGRPRDGLRINATLRAKNARLGLPRGAELPLDNLTFNARWKATAAGQTVDSIRLSTDSGVVTGQLSCEGPPGIPECRGAFSGTIAELHDLTTLLRAWLPDQSVDPLSVRGQLHLSELRFSGPLSAWDNPPGAWPIERVEVRLNDLAVQMAEPAASLSDGQLDIVWEQEELLFSNGRVRIDGEPLDFSGTIIEPAGAAALDLQLQGRIPAALLDRAELPDGTEIAGHVPFELTIGGSLRTPQYALAADLAPLAIHWNDRVLKKTLEPGSVDATLDVGPDSWQLRKGQLALPFVTLDAHGQLARDAAGAFELQLTAAPARLRDLVRFQPGLGNFGLRGAVSGSFRLTGSNRRITDRSGTLQFVDVAASLNGIIADVSDLNATVEIDNDTLTTDDLTARIGTSRVTAKLRIDDLAAPVATVELTTPKIRADELIFRSPTRHLLDLDATLHISGDGIDFAPVKVRLEQGTVATVTGRADWSGTKIRVDLDIDGDRADVDEIIGLWSDPRRAEPETAAPTQKSRPLTVAIDVTARQGVFHNFSFRDASTHIAWTRGRLILHPLTFHDVANAGFCTGQVIFETRGDRPSRLRVSGYGSAFEAATVYESLLQKEAPLSGELRTAFYLDGVLDGDYPASLNGGVSLRVKDGVLRRFKVLSKVFSLLNVSQIFELKLPDMAREGMPFERIDASFKLTDGALRTEDLFVKSNAMNLSLIGDINLASDSLDLILGIKPLRTVDRIITKIPLAGWILTGEEKALITAQFRVTGPIEEPEVKAIPITSLSDTVFGIFKRVLGLPGKVVGDVGEFLRDD